MDLTAQWGVAARRGFNFLALHRGLCRASAFAEDYTRPGQMSKILIAVLVVLLAAAAYWLYKRRKSGGGGGGGGGNSCNVLTPWTVADGNLPAWATMSADKTAAPAVATADGGPQIGRVLVDANKRRYFQSLTDGKSYYRSAVPTVSLLARNAQCGAPQTTADASNALAYQNVPICISKNLGTFSPYQGGACYAEKGATMALLADDQLSDSST